MWTDIKSLKDQLIHLENLKAGITTQLNLIGGNKEAVRPTTAYPMAKIKPLQINGYTVLQLNYDGMLPHHIRDRGYERLLQDYYFESTLSAFDFSDLEGIFDTCVILYCQYFKNRIRRDLDNRTLKYIQDAIRLSCVIKDDDDWQKVWNMNLGFLDRERDHVQVYVVERKYFTDFFNELMKNHHNIKNTNDFVVKKEEFIERHKKNADKLYDSEEDNDEKMPDYFW